MEKVEKVWGFEEIWVNNELYCCKFLHIKKNYRSSYHYHKAKDETFVVFEGEVMLRRQFHVDKVIVPGDVVRIPPNMLHSFEGLLDSVLLEVSTHDTPDDSFRYGKSCCVLDSVKKEMI